VLLGRVVLVVLRKEGGQVINGYLIPAEWGTSVELGSVKRGPPSGCMTGTLLL
jgi:hypothetical protein